jgi:hypothetical protein
MSKGRKRRVPQLQERQGERREYEKERQGDRDRDRKILSRPAVDQTVPPTLARPDFLTSPTGSHASLFWNHPNRCTQRLPAIWVFINPAKMSPKIHHKHAIRERVPSCLTLNPDSHPIGPADLHQVRTCPADKQAGTDVLRDREHS